MERRNWLAVDNDRDNDTVSGGKEFHRKGMLTKYEYL